MLCLCKHDFCCLGSNGLAYIGLLALRSGVLLGPSSELIAVLEVLVDCGGMASDIAYS